MHRLTREYFESLLQRTDNLGMHAVGRALVVLNERQAAYEQARGGLPADLFGFQGTDATAGASMAQFYRQRNMLTPAHLCFWQARRRFQPPRILNYIEQLLVVAREKQALRSGGDVNTWADLRHAVMEYYDVLDSDSAEFINPAEAKVSETAAKLGMDFRQALDVCGSGEVSGVMKF